MGSAGFTLVEVLTATVIFGMVLVLSAGALRHFWFVQSLDNSTDEAVSQLRQLQTRVVSESHPLVYGIRFRKNSPDYALITFDPRAVAPAVRCVQDGATRSFDSGSFGVLVRVSANVTSVPDSPEATICRSDLPGVISNDVFVFFYARGTATAGTIRLDQPNLGRGENIVITGLTGRVERT